MASSSAGRDSDDNQRDADQQTRHADVAEYRPLTHHGTLPGQRESLCRCQRLRARIKRWPPALDGPTDPAVEVRADASADQAYPEAGHGRITTLRDCPISILGASADRQLWRRSAVRGCGLFRYLVCPGTGATQSRLICSRTPTRTSGMPISTNDAA